MSGSSKLAKINIGRFEFSPPAIITALVLMLAAGVVFFPVLHAELVHWDDDINIFANPHIQKLNLESVGWMFTDVQYTPRYRPLNWLAWATIIHFFGLNGPVFHAHLLILHVANALLIFVLLKKIIAWRLRVDSGGWPANIAVGLATAIWALHPMRVEVVGWANCAIYTQSLFFLLLSLIFYFRAVKPGSSRRKEAHSNSVGDVRASLRRLLQLNGSLWLSVIFYSASLLTYPAALGWIVVLLVLDIFLLRRISFADRFSPENRRVLLEKVPFAIVTLASAAATLWARATMSGIWTGMSDLRDFGWFPRTMQAFYVWTYYVWKTWLPFDLAPVYTRLVSFKPTDAIFLFSAMFVIGTTVFLVFKRHRWPLLLALWICHLVLLVPMLGLTEHPHYTNDRYSYIVGILWTVLIAFGLLKFWDNTRIRFGLLAGCSAAAVAFAAADFRQIQLWQNSETLFRGTIARLGADPYRCDVQWRYGLFLAGQRNYADAAQAFSQALSSNPKMIRARYDRAGVLARQRKLDEAAAQYREVLQLNPKFADANYNLGVVLSQMGRADEAAQYFSAAVENQPTNPEAHLQYGTALAMTGKMREALARFHEASRLKPDSLPALLNLSRAHAELREWTPALDTARRALKLASADKNLSEQIQGAIQAYESSLREGNP